MMYLKNFAINALKYDVNPVHFLSAAGLAWKACLKKNRSRIRIMRGVGGVGGGAGGGGGG